MAYLSSDCVLLSQAVALRGRFWDLYGCGIGGNKPSLGGLLLRERSISLNVRLDSLIQAARYFESILVSQSPSESSRAYA